MSLVRRVLRSRVLRPLVEPLRAARTISRFTFRDDEAGPFGHLPRLPRREIASRLLAWRRRHGDLRGDALFYGIDRDGGVAPESVVAYDLFKAIRDRSNRTLTGPNDYNYACLVQDKFVYGQYARSLGHPVPVNLALLSPGGVELLGPRRPPAPLASLWSGEVEWDGFCKPVAGGQGQGIFSLTVSGGEVCVSGEPVTPDELAARLRGRSVVQERIVQHPDVAAFHPSSINTLRIITVVTDDGPRPLTGVFRVGGGGSVVDNYAQGGMIVEIDLDRGVVVGEGYAKEGRAPAARHPDTGVPFDGFEIPHYHEAVRSACRFHEDLYGSHSLGWDIAFSPDGPVLIEANDRWDGYLAILDPTAIPRYLAMLGVEDPRTDRPSPHRHRWARALGSAPKPTASPKQPA